MAKPQHLANSPHVGDGPWSILVVDDDEAVHISTELALAQTEIEGREVKILHAYTAAEALTQIERRPDLAVALIDVVMEASDSGLRLVQDIRMLPDRAALRLILRTGQPGYAPELETVRHYDINDYWNKLDQTRTKLLVSLTTAIRSYRHVVDVEKQRDTLDQLNKRLQAATQAERDAVTAKRNAEAALVTLRKSVETEIADRTEELLETVRVLESFNRMVAHDLRGPLSGVSGMMELIQERLEAGDLARIPQWIDLVITQTKHLSALVIGLLELSMLARATPNWQPTRLDTLVREAVETVRGVGAAAEQSLAVDFQISPMPTVHADPVLLRQVFVNLMSNAAKFCRSVESPTVHVSAQKEEQRVVVSVRDNGIGFDPNQAGKLFQPFARLHGKAFEGTGIGLTIVKRIVEMHRGQVWAESAPGRGAAFRFSLPLAPPP